MDHKGVLLTNTPLTNKITANCTRGQDPTPFFEKKKTLI